MTFEGWPLPALGPAVCHVLEDTGSFPTNTVTCLAPVLGAASPCWGIVLRKPLLLKSLLSIMQNPLLLQNSASPLSLSAWKNSGRRGIAFLHAVETSWGHICFGCSCALVSVRGQVMHPHTAFQGRVFGLVCSDR